MDQQFKAHLNQNIKTEIRLEKKQEIEYVLQGTIKPKTGHFIWEVNEETGEIKRAKFKRTTAAFGAAIPPEELIVKLNCTYIPALNAENAKKKYLKSKDQSSYYAKEPVMKLGDYFI